MYRSEKGVSAVEFALVAPMLFVLTLGLIEFALLLFDKAVITNASREGARAAIVYNCDTSDYLPVSITDIKNIVRQYAEGYLINLGVSGNQDITDADINVTYDGPSGSGVPESGGDVTVTVTYDYDFLVFPDMTQLLGGTIDDEIQIVGTTTMRME